MNQRPRLKVLSAHEDVPQATSAGPPEERPLLTVIIPVYNEAATIAEPLRRVLAAPYSKQIVVVDDGSTAGTVQALAAWNRDPCITLARHFKIHETPIHYDARSVRQGKKIRWADGWEAMVELWKWRNWHPSGLRDAA